MTSEKNWKKKVKEIFSKYEAKIVVFLGMILVAVISFEVGILQGQKWQQEPMIVEVPAVVVAGAGSETAIDNVNVQAVGDKTQENINQKNPTECVFVGSKNSDKYHVPTCSYAKRIKPENIVCFKDKKEAEARGYTADKCVK
jgi:hypothetical protein